MWQVALLAENDGVCGTARLEGSLEESLGELSGEGRSGVQLGGAEKRRKAPFWGGA